MIKQRIAFLGTGLMGAPMVRRLLAAGYEVSVWNRSSKKAEALRQDGAKVCQTIRSAVSEAELVITMLSGFEALNAVLFGPDGVAATCPRDALVIDMSSLAPDLARSQHSRLAEQGVSHLDAPVSGGVPGAEAGSLAIMVGGKGPDFDRAKHVFEAMGTPFHLGDAGAGQVCKMVNQTIVHVTIGAVTEGLLLAAAMGVDAGRVREAISGGFCQSRILELHGARMVERNFVPGGPARFSKKDLASAQEHADAAGLELPLTKALLDRYSEMVADGLGGLDHSALLLDYERRNKPNRVSPNLADQLPDDPIP
ncbi:MAG: NAD(P)-dependent oxidoreductase [Pseudomonadota bacterium]